MKRVMFVSIVGLAILVQYFIASEQMNRSATVAPKNETIRDESLLKTPVFVPEKHEVPNLPYINPVADSSNDQIKDALLPLIDSESVEMAAALLKGLPVKRAKEIADMVFADKAFRINMRDRRLFLCAVAANYKDKPEEQADFFEIMLKYPDLYEGEPLTFTLIANDYESAVPGVIRTLELWRKAKKISLPKGIDDLVERGYTEVLKRNDAHVLGHMEEEGVELDPLMASKLLWRAAGFTKSTPDFVKLFKDKGADLNFNKDGYSPLMMAAASGNLPFVKALVEAGAPIDTIFSNEVGSALQQAVEKGFVAIELYLRSKGARL